MDSEMVEVTQADREAAWKYRPNCYNLYDYTDWMAGEYDLAASVIKGFARHRLAAIAAMQQGEPVAGEETCVLCAGECRGHGLGDSKAWEPEPGSRAALAAENAALREALNAIDIEAFNTIPQDGGEAAFAALDRIARIITPFRVKGAQ